MAITLVENVQKKVQLCRFASPESKWGERSGLGVFTLNIFGVLFIYSFYLVFLLLFFNIIFLLSRVPYLRKLTVTLIENFTTIFFTLSDIWMMYTLFEDWPPHLWSNCKQGNGSLTIDQAFDQTFFLTSSVPTLEYQFSLRRFIHFFLCNIWDFGCTWKQYL